MGWAVYHVVKQEGGWAVRSSAGGPATSVHRTQEAAAGAARRAALRGGGADVVIHRADGRVRDADTIGAPTAGLTTTLPANVPARSVQPETGAGQRTTLRVPPALLVTADRLAAELQISRNDALLRLATRGAQQYEREQRIAGVRDARWAAVVPGALDVDAVELPSPDEARAAVLGDAGRADAE